MKIKIVFLLVLATLALPVSAQGLADYEAGFRLDLQGGNGKPGNDILGYSLIGRYRLNSDWVLEFAYERADEWDAETPYEEFQISSVEEIDAKTETSIYSIGVERRYSEKRNNAYWFWGTSLGFSDVKPKPASGMTLEGDPWTLVFDVDSETVVAFKFGRRHNLGNNFSLDYGLRADYRMGDWFATEVNSGERRKIFNDYWVKGLFLSASYRF